MAGRKLQRIELPTADIGDSAALKVGHFVLAVARPGESGRGLNASLGVINAGGTWRIWSGGQIDQFVRLDLTLYPGCSGGPLGDAQGRIIGINRLITGGLALAVPSRLVERFLRRRQLNRSGDPGHPSGLNFVIEPPGV